MNILYVLNSGNPGGMEQHVLDLVRGMIDLGNTVYVWCPQGDFMPQFEEAGALVSLKKIGFDVDPKYIVELSRFIKSKNIDLVHSHELKAGVNAMISGKIAGVPVVTHTHTPILEWQIPLVKKRLNTFLYSFFVNHFSAVEIALTESRKRAKIMEGIREFKLKIIPNAVKIDDINLSQETRIKRREEILKKYNIPLDSYVFGFISRISVEKGHKTLVEAYKKVKETLSSRGIVDKTFLFIGGGGDLEAVISSQIADLGLEQCTLITGRFSAEDKPKFYSSLDSFIFPTLAEGFGIVLIEAMANSLPVICSDLEVLQEVGGSAVRYFETANSDDLAEKMVDMYVRADQYKDLAIQGFERVKDLYSMEGFVQKYYALYLEVLNR